MVSSNKFVGLARGPIDHESSSVINVISSSAITMGSVVALDGFPTSEILPRVLELSSEQGSQLAYGIAVGGDNDGIYGPDGTATSTPFRATTTSSQGVVVVTQGRCPARVKGTQNGSSATINIGDKLTMSTLSGILEKAVDSSSDFVIATALNSVAADDTDIIAVDVQREGTFVS